MQLQDLAEPSLWLTVGLQEHLYAINCRYVKTIFEIKQGLQPSDIADESIIGQLELSGRMLPVMDLRKRFHLKTVQEELAEFQEMLAQRKQDHIHWVDTLKHCIHTNEKFPLATDPHRCKFGQWYDSYQPTSRVVKYYFDQINQPHTKLHESALLCLAANDMQEKQRILKEQSEKAMHQVLHAMDNALAAYQNSHRRMCVTVSDGTIQLGLLVDEVAATQMLQDVHEVGTVAKNPSVHAMAHQADGTAVLLIDTAQILSEIARR